MLRALSLSILVSIALPAIAGAELGDDIATCRDRGGDPKARQDACERLITDNKVTGKDLALAYAVRGRALSDHRNDDKAIEAYNKALELDPGNADYLNARGFSFERRPISARAIWTPR